MSGKGTFSCTSFSFAPVVGVEYFGAFFGRERCILCFCAPKKNACGHPLRQKRYGMISMIPTIMIVLDRLAARGRRNNGIFKNY